jgi:2-dehydro-3-deoxyphosphooctonate aldolase (KDO 8-P synthase)
MDTAFYLKDLTAAYPDVLFIFKASFDKANRTSVGSYRGPGLSRGLKILEKVKTKCNVPILSDVHCVDQVKAAAAVLDIIQIPAFLCRQTDLILAAAKTKKIINIKKGQFLAPGDIKYIVEKIKSTGNDKIIITERGSSFGYNNLVVDFRSFLWLRKLGYPVVYDATHSLQRPSAAGGISGGDREFVAPLAKAAVACGVDGLFMEVHSKPSAALSDKHAVYPLGKVGALLKTIFKIRTAIK